MRSSDRGVVIALCPHIIARDGRVSRLSCRKRKARPRKSAIDIAWSGKSPDTRSPIHQGGALFALLRAVQLARRRDLLVHTSLMLVGTFTALMTSLISTLMFPILAGRLMPKIRSLEVSSEQLAPLLLWRQGSPATRSEQVLHAPVHSSYLTAMLMSLAASDRQLSQAARKWPAGYSFPLRCLADIQSWEARLSSSVNTLSGTMKTL